MTLQNDNTIETMVAREVDRHARFWTLLFLDRGNGRLNNRILLNLLAATGHHLTAQHFDELLEILSRDGLLTAEIFEDLKIVNLSEEGQEVARGRRVREDIIRPPLPRLSGTDR
jgi:hypothetical protein